jgi:hypothetical protein
VEGRGRIFTQLLDLGFDVGDEQSRAGLIRFSRHLEVASLYYHYVETCIGYCDPRWLTTRAVQNGDFEDAR